MIDRITEALKVIEEFKNKYGKPPPYIEVTQEQLNELRKQVEPFCVYRTDDFGFKLAGIEIRLKETK